MLKTNKMKMLEINKKGEFFTFSRARPGTPVYGGRGGAKKFYFLEVVKYGNL